jgi:hypothetical protein
MDFVTANQNNDTVTVFLGNGDGTVTLSATLDDNGGGGRACVGDFDRDGNLDVAATFGLGIWFGHGDGTFEPVFTGVSFYSIDMRAADAKGDDILDLVGGLADGGSGGGVGVAISNGDGTFQPTLITPHPDLNRAAIGYINTQDAIIDVVITTSTAWAVDVYLRVGDGTFMHSDTQDPGYGDRVAIGDVNRDGSPDILVSDFINPQVSVLAGDGTGQLATPAMIPTSVGFNGFMFIADYDGDFIPDVAIADQSNGIVVGLATSPGAYGTFTGTDVGQNEFHVVAADFNNDNKLDLVVANISSNDLVILLGN